MSPEQDIPSDLRSLEASLASLRPASGGLDRDRLMFLAGQESARRSRLRPLAWPAALAAMTGAAAALLAALLVRPGPAVVERVVYVPAPAAQSAPESPQPAPAPVSPPEERSPGKADSPESSAFVLRLPGIPAAVMRRAEYLRELEQSARRSPDRPTPSPMERPASRGETSAPSSYRQMLDSLLDEPAGRGA